MASDTEHENTENKKTSTKNKVEKEETVTKEDNVYRFISLTSDQKAVVLNFYKQENNLKQRYLDASRKLGELEEQLALAKNAERQLRTQLNQAEVFRKNEINNFAKELGWKESDRWNYIDNEFGFVVLNKD